MDKDKSLNIPLKYDTNRYKVYKLKVLIPKN